MNSGLLSIKEVAELLQSKESTVRTWIKRGQIPSHLIFKIGATVRIREEKFNNWINGNECLQKT